MTDSTKGLNSVVLSPQSMQRIAQTNGATLWLTRRELGEAGYRRVVGTGGQMVGQFALRMRYGEFVYPEFRGVDETANDVIARVRRDAARTGGER